MEEMILEAIEDCGAQGASFKQIVDYIDCADIELDESTEDQIQSAIMSLVGHKKLIMRRNRFFAI